MTAEPVRQLTVSQRAVLRSVDLGAGTCEEIQMMTGAATWWIQMNVWELVHMRLLACDSTGRGLRRT